MSDLLTDAVLALQHGGVIAYPTEAVFGLGCDPNNETAIQRILDLKQRSVEKGLLLIAAESSQLSPYIAPIDSGLWQKAQQKWPGPMTWLVPANEQTSRLLTGSHSTIGVRVTAHPVAKLLCKHFGRPIVSTSANLSGMPAARSKDEVIQQFDGKLESIVDGDVDSLAQPSEIRDLITNQIIRSR